MKHLQIFCFIILLFLSSCVPVKYFSVPVDYDAKFSFKPDTTTIVLVSQLNFSKAKVSGKRSLDALKSGAFTAIKYAGSQLSQLAHVRVINLVDSATVDPNTQSIKSLTDQYHSDYVLAITSISAAIELSSTQSSTAYYNSNVSVNFVLYEGNGVYSKKLQGAVDEPQSEGLYLGLVASLVVHPTIGGNKESVNLSAKHATKIALQDYFPYSLMRTRALYTDEVLQPANNEIYAGNYDKAYTLLEPFLKDKDPKLVSKAAFNLAIIYEAQGDIDIAIEMAQLSLDKHKNQFATALMKELKTE